MPDADDFDVEYFRNLMKGIAEGEEHAACRATAKPAPAKGRASRRPDGRRARTAEFVDATPEMWYFAPRHQAF